MLEIFQFDLPETEISKQAKWTLRDLAFGQILAVWNGPKTS